MARKQETTAEIATPDAANGAASARLPTLAESLDRYQAECLNPNTGKLPGVARQIRTAYFAGAHEAIILIAESDYDRQFIRRLADEARGGPPRAAAG